MKIHQILHALAMGFLLIVAVLNLSGQIHRNIGSGMIYFIPIVFGFVLWAFLLWKIYDRPKQWGLGAGIFLLLMSAFQIYLWQRAMSRPDHIGLGVYAKPWNFLLYETPIVVGGVCCILLRWSYPLPPSSNGLKDG